MGLRDRIHPDRRHIPERDADTCDDCSEQMAGREPFVAPWRRRQIEQAGGRFVAVAWREVPAA